MPRNASGTYTLPLPPVVPDTTIESVWANTSLDDLAQAVTDSLSRTGQGGMTAPLRFVDGTVASPGFAWQVETGTGFYRESTAVMSAAVQGVKIAQWSPNGFGMAAGKFLTLPDAPVALTDAANKAYVDSVAGGGGGGAFATKAGTLASGGGQAGFGMIFTASALASTPSVVWGSDSGNFTNNGYNTATLAVGTAATVRNAAQPLITSVGTLTSLVVSGATALQSYASYIGIELGWRSSPKILYSNQVLPAGVRGYTVVMTGNNMNGGAADVRILAGPGMTVHNGGTVAVNNVSLLPWGGARIWFLSATEAVMSGNTQ
jgi:hypothetical protein